MATSGVGQNECSVAKCRRSLWLVLSGVGLCLLPFLALLTRRNFVLMQGDFAPKFIPSKKLWLETVLGEGRLPQWNEYLFAGTPYWADLKGAVLYPFNIIFLLFSPENIHYAISWYVVAHIPFIFLGAFLCLRSFRVKNETAFVFAIMYTLSGAVISTISYRSLFPGQMLLPYIIYFSRAWLQKFNSARIEGCQEKTRLIDRSSLGLIFTLALPIYGAAIEITMFASLVLAVVVLARASRKEIFHFFVIGIFAVSLAAPQLFPGIDFLLRTPRVDASTNLQLLMGYDFHPSRLIELIIQYPFGSIYPEMNYWGLTPVAGRSPLIFSSFLGSSIVLGLLAFIVRFRMRGIFAYVLLIFCLLCAFGAYIEPNLYLLVRKIIPILKLSRYAEKYIVPFSFLLVLFSALGWNQIFTRNFTSKQYRALGFVYGGLVAGIAIYLYVFFQMGANKVDGQKVLQFLILSAVLGLFYLIILPLRPGLARLSAWPLILVVLFESGLHTHKSLWPQSIQIYEQEIAKDINRHKEENSEEIRAGAAYRYSSLYAKLNKGNIPRKISLAENSILSITEGYVSTILPSTNILYGIHEISGAGALYDKKKMQFFRNLSAADLRKTFNLLSTKYIGTSNPGDHRFRAVVNQEALPYIFMPEKIRFENNSDDAIVKILSKDFNEQNSGIIETSELKGTAENGAILSIDIYRRESIAKGMKLKTDLYTESGWMILNESYNPHWRAYIDGQKVPVHRANAWAMGIPLGKNCNKSCDILFAYENRYIFWGVLAALIAFLILIVLYFVRFASSSDARVRIESKGFFPYLSAVQNQIRLDNSEFKRDLFESLLAKSKPLRIGYRLCNVNILMQVFTCLIYFYYRGLAIRPEKPKPIVAAPVFGNEKRILSLEISKEVREQLAEYTKHKKFIWINIFKILPLLRLVQRTGFVLRQSYSVLKDNPLYVGMRCAELHAYYVNLLRPIKSANIVLATTDANPNGVALLCLAKIFQKPVIFVSHGEPNPPINHFDVDLAYLLGEESLKRYKREGTKIKEVIYAGYKEFASPIAPIQEHSIQRVGLFLGKFDSLTNLQRLIATIKKNFTPISILLRDHPNFPLKAKAKQILSAEGLELSESVDIFSEIGRCDFVVAGNSTSHLEILLSGKPSLYYFDGVEKYRDRYQYVSTGLILEFTDSTNAAMINSFYSRSEGGDRIDRHLCTQTTRAESKAALNQWILARLS